MKLQSQLAGKMIRDNPTRTTTKNFKTGTWGPAWQQICERGFFTLWKGVWFHLGNFLLYTLTLTDPEYLLTYSSTARDTLGTAIYFSVYEAVKQTLANARGHDPTDRRASMLAGGLCGIFSWIFVSCLHSTTFQPRLTKL